MIAGTFYIEAQGNNEKLVVNSLKSLAEKLKKEEKIKINREFLDKVTVEDGNFSSVLEVDLEFEDLLTYVMAAIHYGPSAIEISEPEELVMAPKDFLAVVGEIIKISKTFYQKYNVDFRFSKGKKAKVGLDESEIDELIDQGAIRAKIVVEAKGKTKKEAIDKFLTAIENELIVKKVKTKEVESETPFSGLVGVDALMHDAKTLVAVAIKHTPVLIEILEPEEIKLMMLDIQDIGIELASVFFEVAYNLAKPTK